MLRTSNEATDRQVQLAREQGDVLRRTFEAMKTETGHAAVTRSGDWVIGYAAERAEGLYEWRDGRLEWIEPEDENAHLEILVADADWRFVPGLDVSLTLARPDGQEIATHKQPLLWHPWLLHYGRNWRVPDEGPYDLRIRIEPLALARHDKVNGKRLASPVEVTFRDVTLETGQKRS